MPTSCAADVQNFRLSEIEWGAPPQTPLSLVFSNTAHTQTSKTGEFWALERMPAVVKREWVFIWFVLWCATYLLICKMG